MKGIILAGGTGTRLFPMTQVVSKQILPVYDKPMVYYPLSVLLLSKIREILIITTPDEQTLFKKLIGDGSQWGVKITYAVQPEPGGLAQAFLIGKNFLNGSPSCLVLGDNIIYGHGLTEELQKASQLTSGGSIFAYKVKDPQRYGVVEFDETGKVMSLEEKPTEPKSNFAVPGIYFYDGEASKIAESLKPSPRGELEITDLNKVYLSRGKLRTRILGRGIAWFDTGTPTSLLQAANYVEMIYERQGFKIGCLEEIAYGQGFIDSYKILAQADRYGKSDYGKYIRDIVATKETDLFEKLRNQPL
jgi:glucose-1-phosphate thymidylyltransferase